MMIRLTLLCLSVSLLSGCTSSTAKVAPPPPVGQSSGLQEVTFFVSGMNQKLQILWGDWPNKVKQALDGLEGVESVEDEWEREIESDEDLDLLFVTYRTESITIERMKKTIEEFGFTAEVKEKQ